MNWINTDWSSRPSVVEYIDLLQLGQNILFTWFFGRLIYLVSNELLPFAFSKGLVLHLGIWRLSFAEYVLEVFWVTRRKFLRKWGFGSLNTSDSYIGFLQNRRCEISSRLDLVSLLFTDTAYRRDWPVLFDYLIDLYGLRQAFKQLLHPYFLMVLGWCLSFVNLIRLPLLDVLFQLEGVEIWR